MQMSAAEQKILLPLQLVHLLGLIFEERSCLLILNLLVIAHEAAGDGPKTLTVNSYFKPVSEYRAHAPVLSAITLSIGTASCVGQVPMLCIPALATICGSRALVPSCISPIFADSTSSLLVICLLIICILRHHITRRHHGPCSRDL
jgi:hypothetical protein